MPPAIVKTESRSDNSTESDPYAAVATALEQAQRALSTARGQPVIATIPIAESEAQLNEVCSRILGLEEDVDRYRRAFVNLKGAAKERDDARTEVESKVREMADLKRAHEKERLELVASVKEERKRLQREREDLAKEYECLDAERVALEAEKKTILETRSIPASQPKNRRTTTLAPKPPAAATRASTRKQGKRAASPPAPSAPPPPKRKRVTSPHPPATPVTSRSLAPRPDAHVLTNLQVEAMYQFCSTLALADTMAIRAEQRVTTPAHLRTLVESYVAENGTFPDIDAVAPQFAHLFRLSSSSQPPSHAGPSTFPDA